MSEYHFILHIFISFCFLPIYREPECYLSLFKLCAIAEEEDGWIRVIVALVLLVPLGEAFSGPEMIALVLDALPLPSKVITVIQAFLSLAEEVSLKDIGLNVQEIPFRWI